MEASTGLCHAPDPSAARGLLAAGSCGPRGRVAKLAGVSESICAGESHRSKAGAHLRAGQPAAEPQVAPGTPGDRAHKSSQPNGGGKDAAWKSRKTDFSPPLGNPAKDAGFPLSHRRNNNSPRVTFQMARRTTLGVHS